MRLFSDKLWYSPSDIFIRAAEALIWNHQKFTPPVLEIGCGNGRISSLLFMNKTKVDVGVDIDAHEIENAKKIKLYSRLAVADAAELPFQDRKFNTVVANSTFEHIRKDISSVCEVFRILKEGGSFMFTVPTRRFESALLSTIINKNNLQKINDRLKHFHYREVDEWIAILKNNGFSMTSYQEYMSDNAVKDWYKLFRLSTFKVRGRELWSYLENFSHKKIIPKKIFSILVSSFLLKLYHEMFVPGGTWLFIAARKLK